MGRQPNFGTPIAFGLVIAALIMGYFEYSSGNANGAAEKTIHVVGAASEAVEADRVVWKGRTVNETSSLQRGYASVQTDRGLLEGFLSEQGIDSSRMVFKPVKVHGHSSSGRTGRYTLEQGFMLRGDDPMKVQRCAQKVAALMERGVRIETQRPRFRYSDLESLRERLNTLAAKKARQKAEALADSSGVTLGQLQALKEDAFRIEGEDPTEGSAPSYEYSRSPDQTVKVRVEAKFAIE